MRSLLLLSVLGLAACQTSPEVKSEPTVLVTLKRGPCNGRCPVYSVSVQSDGRVIFDGVRNVAYPGETKLKMASSMLEQLKKALDGAPLDSWKDSYDSKIVDAPTAELTFRGRTVKHSMADETIPPELKALEEEVDRLAGTPGWLSGPPM